MKKLLLALLMLSVLLAGCDNSRYLGNPGEKEILYPGYGVIDENTARSKDVCYEVSPENLILGIVLIETIVVPIYIFGWNILSPIRLKTDPKDDCSFKG